MSAITTHILDVARGRPAAKVSIVLEARRGDAFVELGRGVTDDDGRCKTLLAAAQRPEPGVYRLRFETGAYFEARGEAHFHPFVELAFTVDAPGEHYHVPLLLSPFGFTTYRGS
jgi:5-hydroxyisourate hydrolase